MGLVPILSAFGDGWLCDPFFLSIAVHTCRLMKTQWEWYPFCRLYVMDESVTHLFFLQRV
jgi:hypothetical protein